MAVVSVMFQNIIWLHVYKVQEWKKNKSKMLETTVVVAFGEKEG